MANEISVSASLSVSKGGASISATGTVSFTMSGDQMLSNVQIIGTAAEAITVGDVATIGYVFLKNMDATNFVEVALDSGVSTQKIAKILAGGIALFPASTATLYAKADTANVNLLVGITEL